jgi:hypothetical protein
MTATPQPLPELVSFLETLPSRTSWRPQLHIRANAAYR